MALSTVASGIFLNLTNSVTETVYTPTVDSLYAIYCYIVKISGDGYATPYVYWNDGSISPNQVFMAGDTPTTILSKANTSIQLSGIISGVVTYNIYYSVVSVS